MDPSISTFRIKGTNSKYKPRPSDLVINWGTTSNPWEVEGVKILNTAQSISLCVNKRSFFSALYDAGVREMPPFLSSHEEVLDMFLRAEEDQAPLKVYCRTLLESSEGRGIVVATNREEVVPAHLYTLGIPRILRELRVHCFQSSVIDYAQKMRIGRAQREAEGLHLNRDVRNRKGSWIYARENVQINEELESICLNAMEVLGLDFGAFDILEDRAHSYYLLECNTAPGLTGTTLDRYAEAILNAV